MSNVVPMTGNEFADIPLADIYEEEFLPRKHYSPEALEELAASINEHGMMHTVLVSRRDDGKYTLVVGSRRIRAAQKAGHTHVHACISDTQSKADIILTALAENAQREPLEPLEEANAFLMLARDLKLTLDDIARGASKTRGYVVKRLKLLDLAEDVQRLVADEVLPASTAEKLAHIPSGENQYRIAKVAIEDNLSAAEVTKFIQEQGVRHVKTVVTGNGEMTVRKYRIRITRMTEQVRNEFALIEGLPMTPEERGELSASLLQLEQQASAIRERLSKAGRIRFNPHKKNDRGNAHRERNHGDEWPSGDLAHFDNARMSDAAIARLVGRSESAVRSMRAKYRTLKKRA